MSVRSLAAALVCSVAGCADVLGGLDEGRARDAGATSASIGDGSVEATSCSPWLPGLRHRVAFDVVNAGPEPLEGFAVRLALDTRAPIEAGRMRPDVADLRVTGADGRTLLGHFIQGRPGGNATVVWAKLDLAPGPNRLFVYYGGDAATRRASMADVFFEGIIDNPSFDAGNAPWQAIRPLHGGDAQLAMGEGRATIAMTRSAATDASPAGFCQLVAFPAGRRYRLVFDSSVPRHSRGLAAIWVGGLEGRMIWSSTGGRGIRRGIDTGPIDPGTTWLCIGGVALPNGNTDLSVEFRNLRVRSYAEHDPLSGLPAPEETCTP